MIYLAQIVLSHTEYTENTGNSVASPAKVTLYILTKKEAVSEF
jgi:hypothetical protein